MRTLVISNNLGDPGLADIHVRPWHNHPAITDYECVVVDLDFEGLDPRIPNFPFYSLLDDVVTLQRSGGIVICLNHLTVTNSGSTYNSGRKEHAGLLKFRQDAHAHEYKVRGGEESNYDWLDQGFLAVVHLDVVGTKAGAQITPTTQVRPVKDYFERFCGGFHKVIDGVAVDTTGVKGVIRWAWREMPDYSSRRHTLDVVEVLGIARVTKQPVAIAMQYMGTPGRLVILPTWKTDKTSQYGVLLCLQSIGLYYAEQVRDASDTVPLAPEWVRDYEVKESRDIYGRMQKLEEKRASLARERDRYDEMLLLTYGTGVALQNAVAKLFGDEWLKFQVALTDSDASFDLMVTDRTTMRTLVVEVTGVTGKFNKNNPHLADVLSYLPEYVEKNESARTERIVLAVNTFKDTPPRSRDPSQDITDPPRKIATINEFLLIRTYDLFRLWCDFIEGKRTPPNIFDLLFNSSGVFEYQPVASQ